MALQDAVAKAVVREIRIRLTAGERKLLDTPRAVDPEAYEAYLRGRYLWDISGEKNLGKAREYFEQAIRKDPGYAQAWAGIADTYGRLAAWGALPLKDIAPLARAAAAKALELDPDLAEAMVTLADIKTNYEWDWAGAEQLYKRAIELNPTHGEAHAGYATYLAEVGRTREAVTEAIRSREVEPLSGVYSINVVWKLYLDRQYAQAEMEDQRISRLVPDHTGGYIIASVYLHTGRPREAVAALRKAADLWGRNAPELTFLAHGLGVTGARAEAQKVMRELEGRKYVPPEYLAVAYEGLGERERALQCFEKAYAEHSMNGWFVPDPRLDQIRKEPRFRKIMRGMGLPVVN
jgi:tetratricopeptide (TPR) repeat protein